MTENPHLRQGNLGLSRDGVLPCRVALLTNFVPPYHLPLLSLLATRVGELRIFVSTLMEPNRAWNAAWGSLNVVRQKTVTWTTTWKHPAGFSETQYVHVPLDTIPLLVKYRPDAIVSTEMGMRSVGVILYRLAHPGTRVVLWLNLSERTEMGRGMARESLRRLMLHLVDGVFVNGGSGVRYLRGLGMPAQAIHRLPYSTDVATFAEIPLVQSESSARRLLYVGQLVPRKGILPFLHVLRRWAYDHQAARVEMTIVGDGELYPDITGLEYPPNLEVRAIGTVPYGDLPRYYGASEILAFPTLADEWGIVVNEALASGLPVLGSIYSQAVEEMVEDGMTGWLLDPEDPIQMYDTVDKALSLPATAIDKMRRKCRESALHYAPNTLIDYLMKGLSGKAPVGSGPDG